VPAAANSMPGQRAWEPEVNSEPRAAIIKLIPR
jgi:hypothetical protein